jgi:pyruvate,orthophosphate dikinase
MAKAVAKSRKNLEKIVAKSKPSKAAPPAARKALTKAPAKPVAKAAKKTAKKTADKTADKTAAKAVVTKPAVETVKSGKWVYTFGDGKAEGKAGLRDLLGGKGANLAEMANLGLPVPPGFTIPTSVCTYFYAHDKSYPAALKAQVEKALEHVGKLTGKAFGDSRNPLLVSVRSGGRASNTAWQAGHSTSNPSLTLDASNAGKRSIGIAGRPLRATERWRCSRRLAARPSPRRGVRRSWWRT